MIKILQARWVRGMVLALGVLTLAVALVLGVVLFPSAVEREAGSAIAKGDAKLLAEVAAKYSSSEKASDRAYAEIYKGFSEFLFVKKADSIRDVRGAFFYLQSTKAKIGRAVELMNGHEGLGGIQAWRVQRRIGNVLKEIAVFERDRLSAIARGVQQEQLQYQRDQQVKSYETWGKSLESPQPKQGNPSSGKAKAAPRS